VGVRSFIIIAIEADQNNDVTLNENTLAGTCAQRSVTIPPSFRRRLPASCTLINEHQHPPLDFLAFSPIDTHIFSVNIGLASKPGQNTLQIG
jgi:hypothetical protein